MKISPTGVITCNRCGIIVVGVFWTARDGKAKRPALGLVCNNCGRGIEVVITSPPRHLDGFMAQPATKAERMARGPRAPSEKS